jgi:uncharacterized protein
MLNPLIGREGVFIDTWGWLVLGHSREARHVEVREIYSEYRKSNRLLYTSDYVLDELITLLYRREIYAEATRFVDGIMLAAANSQLRVERVTAERFEAAWQLRKRFQGKPRISFTDLTSMVIMNDSGIQQVLTEDEHFEHTGMGFVRVPRQ